MRVPGHVLEGVVVLGHQQQRHDLVFADPGVLDRRDRLADAIETSTRPKLSPGDRIPSSMRDRTATLLEAENWYLQRILEHTGNNYSEAAQILDLDRSTVTRRARALSGG